MHVEDPVTRPPLPRPVWMAPAAMLLIALLPMPYGYYVLLRWVVCLAAAWIAWRQLHESREDLAGWVMVGCAILFNPFARIHLEREVWMALNLLAAIAFWWAGRRAARS